MFQVRHAKRNISRAEQEEIVALNRFKLAVVALDFGFIHLAVILEILAASTCFSL